jgi:transcriptional regulator with XRE-family HTH domain
MQGELPKRLRVLRAERGLTIKQAAEVAGVTRETLRELELGRRSPHEPTLAKIANAYGVPVVELLEAAEAGPGPSAEGPRSGPKIKAPRRSPNLGRLSKNLYDRISDFLQRWTEVGDNLQRLEREGIINGYVWLPDLHRNVTSEATFLLRDLTEIGDYAGLVSNVPYAIQSVADRVRTSVDRAMDRAQREEEGTAASALLLEESTIDLVNREKREAEYAELVVNLGAEEVVDLGRELGKRRVQIPRRPRRPMVQAEEKQDKEGPPLPRRSQGGR